MKRNKEEITRQRDKMLHRLRPGRPLVLLVDFTESRFNVPVNLHPLDSTLEAYDFGFFAPLPTIHPLILPHVKIRYGAEMKGNHMLTDLPGKLFGCFDSSKECHQAWRKMAAKRQLYS